jgi:hypothetical protein
MASNRCLRHHQPLRQKQSPHQKGRRPPGTLGGSQGWCGCEVVAVKWWLEVAGMGVAGLGILALLICGLARRTCPPAGIAGSAHALETEEQALVLAELALRRQGLQQQQRAERLGYFDPQALACLLSIAEELELTHGWDPLQVDRWLEGLGFWEREP